MRALEKFVDNLTGMLAWVWDQVVWRQVQRREMKGSPTRRPLGVPKEEEMP